MVEGQRMTVADVVAQVGDGRLDDMVREAVHLLGVLVNRPSVWPDRDCPFRTQAGHEAARRPVRERIVPISGSWWRLRSGSVLGQHLGLAEPLKVCGGAMGVSRRCADASA